MAAVSTPTSTAIPQSSSGADPAARTGAEPPLSLQLTQSGKDTPASSKVQQTQRSAAADAQRPPELELQLHNAFEGFSGSPALQQMSHLGVYLQDCDDESRQAEMIECLQQLPHQTMTLAAQNLKRRAFWLAAEEKIEFDREAELKIVRD